MFKDFYESMWKKTTPQEKKEVVKNTGKYFPQEHSNKIKGIDELAEAVVSNAMKKQDEIVNDKVPSTAYTTKNCELCGKEFQCYRNRGKYCKECARDMQNLYSKKYAEKKAMERKITTHIHENEIRGIKDITKQYRDNIMKRNSVLKQPKKKGNIIVDCAMCGKEFESYRGIGKYCKDCRKKAIAENKAKTQAFYRNVAVDVEGIGKITPAERSVASKRAYRRGTDYAYELKRIANGTEPVRKHTGRPKLVEEPVVIVEQEPTTVMKAEPDYLETLQNAIEIVRVIKDTDDVKVAVDKTYELLVKYLSK